MNKVTFSILFLFCFFLMASCKKDDPVQPTSNYGALIPLKIGNWWSYKYCFYDQVSTCVTEYQDTIRVIAANSDSTSFQIISRYQHILSNGIYRNDDKKGLYFENTLLFKYPASVGDTSESGYVLKEISTLYIYKKDLSEYSSIHYKIEPGVGIRFIFSLNKGTYGHVEGINGNLSRYVIDGGTNVPELEGTWIGTEVNQSTGTWTFTTTGNQISISGNNGAEWYKGTLIINQATTPKQADIQVTECSDAGYVGKTSLFIYKIEGIIGTFAGYEPGVTARPTTFTPDGQLRVFVLTKQ